MLSQYEINELIHTLLPEKKIKKYSLVIMPKDADFERHDGEHQYDRWTGLPRDAECITFTPYYPQCNARSRKEGPYVKIRYFPQKGLNTEISIYKSGDISLVDTADKDFVLNKLEKLINDPNFKIEKIDVESESCPW